MAVAAPVRRGADRREPVVARELAGPLDLGPNRLITLIDGSAGVIGVGHVLGHERRHQAPSWLFHGSRYRSTQSVATDTPPNLARSVGHGIGMGVIPTLAIRAVARPCTLNVGWASVSIRTPEILVVPPLSTPTPPRC